MATFTSSLVAQLVKNPPKIQFAMQETSVRFVAWKDALEKEMAPTPVSLPGKLHWQRNLVGYIVHGITKELDMT